MTKSRYFCTASALAAILAFGAAGQALAQAAPAASTDQAAPHTIDELTVTAQKREQNLQDVPIVVTSVNAQQLQDAGIKDIKDLTIVAPGLTVTTTSSAAITSARIRGVGTVGDNVGLESSVGVVIDGVYRPRNGVAFGDLGDLQRIEVLKGPQGTLFGKNTSAGVINIITKRPEFTFGANGELSVSNYGGYGAAASVTGPIMGDKIAGRLFVADRQRDGFYKRVSGDTNDQNFYTIRGQLLVRPNDDLDINIAADYTNRRERCCGAVQILNAAGPTAVLNSIVPGAIANPPDPKAFRDYGTIDDKKRVEDKGISASIDYQMGDITLTSITAVRDWEQKGGGDTEWTAVDVLRTPGLGAANPAFTRFKQFSQEFRAAGQTERLHWLVGAFFTNEKLTQHTRLAYGSQFEQYANGLFGGALSPVFTGRPLGTTFVTDQGQNDTYKQEEKGAAVFTNNSFNITDKLELTLGARYTWEKKDLDTTWNNTDGAVGCATALARAQAAGGPIPASGALVRAGGLVGLGPYSLLCGTFQNPRFSALGKNFQSLKEDKATGTVKLAYRFNPELLSYVSYARGYKAGGFNLDRIAQPTQTVAGVAAAPVLDTRFAPETVNSYEVGVKNTLLDRTLLLNATVFYQEYNQFQLNAFNGLVFNVTSVPKVISKGIDTDFLWFTPIRGLTLNGGVTYAETYYPRSTRSVLGTPPVTGIPAGSAAGNLRLPGSRLSLAPLWSISAASTYEHELGSNLVGRFAVNAKYVSSYNTGSNLDPVKNQKGFTLVNARVGVGPQDKRWQVEAWAQNLFDKYYYQVAFDAVAQTGSYDAFLGLPRTYGLTLRLQY
jgi:outer membrane receptor protein involved in Fe transport